MTDEKLMQATLMALTLQNVSDRPAPLSTARMQGMVIGRSLRAGETVGCYYNDSGELLRMGDAPGYSTDYFVDDECRMYDFADGKIRIRDGLSDTVIDAASTDAYAFKVVGGGACCAYRISSSGQTWRFFFADGTGTDITLPGSEHDIVMGYRNGLIGVCAGGDHSGVTPYIYAKNGTLLGRLKTLYSATTTYRAKMIVPINAATAMTVINSLTYAASHDNARYFTATAAEGVGEWSGYNVYSKTYLGADQSYMYGSARLSDGGDPASPLEDWVVIRWPLDRIAASEEVAEYHSAPAFSPPPTQFGTVRMAMDGTAKLYEISTMTPLYDASLPSVPNSGGIRENEAFLWVPGSGVYQKVSLGWLMYPTAVYPREAPWAKLGFALRSAKIGTNGVAVTLFE